MTKINYKVLVTIQLSLKELIDLCNVIAENDFSQNEFLKIKNKKIRKLFEKRYDDRHKLWLKIQKQINLEINR